MKKNIVIIILVLASNLIFAQSYQSSNACPTNLTDYDGNTYNTVRIGTQCWMKENLRTTHYADGTVIKLGEDRFNPDCNTSEIPQYGCLYTWVAVTRGVKSSDLANSRIQGVCPTNWHVPTSEDWSDLEASIDKQFECEYESEYRAIAKALATTWGWHNCVDPCTIGNLQLNNNATGFSAVPTGYYYDNEYFSKGEGCYFWCSGEFDNDSGNAVALLYRGRFLSSAWGPKKVGNSVRCMKD